MHNCFPQKILVKFYRNSLEDGQVSQFNEQHFIVGYMVNSNVTDAIKWFRPDGIFFNLRTRYKSYTVDIKR